MPKRTPGLYKRGNVWFIRKTVDGHKLSESTGTGDLQEAERYLAHRIEEIRAVKRYGERPDRTFRDAATRYLETATKKTLGDDAEQLKMLDPYIGALPLRQIHNGTSEIQRFIKARREQGRSFRTINKGLGVITHVLRLCALEYIDEQGRPWLDGIRLIKPLKETDKRKPYPLSWKEQQRLFRELPDHLAEMCLFKVNTGCREHEVCYLEWAWEKKIPELGVSVFVIPAEHVKNGYDRLVILNRTAQSVIENQRGKHSQRVFTFRGRPVDSMNSSAWRKARKRAGLEQVRLHDLKHTWGMRLRSAGVSFEDRQDLLGHKSGRITTHYSAPEIKNLLDAANAVCEEG